MSDSRTCCLRRRFAWDGSYGYIGYAVVFILSSSANVLSLSCFNNSSFSMLIYIGNTLADIAFHKAGIFKVQTF